MIASDEFRVGVTVELDTRQLRIPGLEVAHIVSVVGGLARVKPHIDDPSRQMYYFSTRQVQVETVEGKIMNMIASKQKKDAPTSTRFTSKNAEEKSRKRFNAAEHLPEDYKSSTNRLTSKGEDYHYRYDGWYDVSFFLPLDDGRTCVTDDLGLGDFEWTCVRNLCYEIRPWFQADFRILGDISVPPRDFAYSVHICHRCMRPFYTEDDMLEHLSIFCKARSPPGKKVYERTGSHFVKYRSNAEPVEIPNCKVSVYVVDGAVDPEFCRQLAIYGQCYIESKSLEYDVDIYEFFVATISRNMLPVPRNPSDIPTRESILEFSKTASQYDADNWDGSVIVGYTSRTKHRANHCLSCIAAFAPFQGMKIGRLLISISYDLCIYRQTKCGCEYCGTNGGNIDRPLSFSGRRLLHSYWADQFKTVTREWELRQQREKSELRTYTMEEMVKMCPGIHMDDLVEILETNMNLFYVNQQDANLVDARLPVSNKEFIEATNHRLLGNSAGLSKKQYALLFESQLDDPDEGKLRASKRPPDVVDYDAKYIIRLANIDDRIPYRFHYYQ